LAYPNSGDATKESGVSGAVLATAAQFSQAAASWPASRLVEVWNSFAGLLPFVELKEVKRFTDHTSAVMRIWHVAQRPGEAREQEMKTAGRKWRLEIVGMQVPFATIVVEERRIRRSGRPSKRSHTVRGFRTKAASWDAIQTRSWTVAMT
jgi:hypothetical protein